MLRKIERWHVPAALWPLAVVSAAQADAGVQLRAHVGVQLLVRQEQPDKCVTIGSNLKKMLCNSPVGRPAASAQAVAFPLRNPPAADATKNRQTKCKN